MKHSFKLMQIQGNLMLFNCKKCPRIVVITRSMYNNMFFPFGRSPFEIPDRCSH
jgi:hypothetical protein